VASLGSYDADCGAHDASTDQISATVASVLSEYFKTSERTIFWDDELKANVDPFEGLEGGFFATDWDFKVSPIVVSQDDMY
jgi:hypothetical protein